MDRFENYLENRLQKLKNKKIKELKTKINLVQEFNNIERFFDNDNYYEFINNIKSLYDC